MEIFDIIYNPEKTKLLKFAELYGNKIYNGLEMNLFQAIKSFMIVNKSNNSNFIKKEMINNG
jgi:shikimate 5-dehydrogenase